MVDVIWGNQDLDALATHLITTSESVRLSLVPLMEQAMVEAEAKMKEYVKYAVTNTGEERMLGLRQSKGNSSEPGRVDTGTMYEAIQHSVVGDGTTVVGSWGWLQGLDEETLYFLYQENGTGTLPAMHALLQSFIEVRENLRAEAQAIVNGEL